MYLGATVCQNVFNYDTSDYDYNCYDDGTADDSTRVLPQSGPWRPPAPGTWNPDAPVFTVVDDPQTGQQVTAFVDQQTGQIIPPADLNPTPITLPAPLAQPPVVSTPTAAAPTSTNFLTHPITIAGVTVQAWELLAAGGLAFVLMQKKKKRAV